MAPRLERAFEQTRRGARDGLLTPAALLAAYDHLMTGDPEPLVSLMADDIQCVPRGIRRHAPG